jgi:hypothetical protein
MTGPLNSKTDRGIITIEDLSGGLNNNDPALTISDNEVADCKNAKFLKKGYERWPGTEPLTVQNAINDYIRGEFTHGEADGTQHLYKVHGGKLYEVSKSDGSLTELYELTGQGEAWGVSSHGTFFCSNGSGMCKIEGTTAYRVGIVPPSGVVATGQTSGGNLPDGVYKLYASYARVEPVAGVDTDVLYSQGEELTNVTISGGSGNGSIDISNFLNSSDPQVGNKVIWMTRANLSVYLKWKTTGDNTTESFTITDADPENSLITYGAKAKDNGLPPDLDYLFAFDNRLFGIVNNILRWSRKGYTKYDLDRWPAVNSRLISYRMTALFGCEKHLCLNTEQNGIMLLPFADVNAKIEHFEQQTSFEYVRTVSKWNGNLIGMTRDRIGLFNKETFTFDPWDYGYNIRPFLNRIWQDDGANNRPCGIVHRRDNRMEYMLSFKDNAVNNSNNNRTLILNLSRTYYIDIDRNKTPWELLGRGFNYVVKDTDNILYFAQHIEGAGTIYKELSNHTYEKGIFNDSGNYLTENTDMETFVITKTFIKDVWTKQIIEQARSLLQTTDPSTLLVTIKDDPSKTISQSTTSDALGVNKWSNDAETTEDAMVWAADDDDGTNEDRKWSTEAIRLYYYKGKSGINGYTWNMKFSQTSDEIDFYLQQLSMYLTNVTGRGR